MVLCDSEIRAAIRHGQLIIQPLPPGEHITTSALDLRLGREFKRWRVPRGKSTSFAIDPSQPDFFEEAKQFLSEVPLGDDGTVVIRPHEFLLGITHEWIELPIPSRLAARVEGRSGLARLGLGVHVTAPTIHAGFRGQITLEITNQGGPPVKLRPEMRICQLIFEMTSGTPSSEVTGIFQDQTSVSGRADQSS
jgi:dCTP deaminase